MNTDEVLRNLRAVQKKHENDKLFTFQTDIAGMARDCANCIESLQAQLAEAKLKEVITDMKVMARRERG